MSLTGAVPAHNHSSGASGGILSAVQEVDFDDGENLLIIHTSGAFETLVTLKSFTAQLDDWFKLIISMGTTNGNAISDHDIILSNSGGSGTMLHANNRVSFQSKIKDQAASQVFVHSISCWGRVSVAGTIIPIIQFQNEVGSDILFTGGVVDYSAKQFRNTLAP